MLLVTSNWCVSDGSLVVGPAPGLVGRFRSEVLRASLRAGVGGDGGYRPVQGVAIVCAGDTFDWLTSREWLGDVRPWESGRRAAAARERVAARSLRNGGRLLATLATWARHGLVVPAADRRGRPLPGSVRRVGVWVSLLRGDRDRWIDGTAVGEGVPGLAVGLRWTDGAVTVRHGEEIEPPWPANTSAPTLGESLAVELIARFAASLDESAWMRPRATAVMRGIVAGRLADAPARLAAALDERPGGNTLPGAVREAVVGQWNRAVSAWHRAARRLGVGSADGVDVVDEVATAMTLSADAGPAAATVRWGAATECQGDAAGAAGECEILGHPPAGYVPPASRRVRLLCIGPQPLPDVAQDCGAWGDRGPAGLALFDPPGMIAPNGDGGASVVPSAVVVHTGLSGTWLDWLPIAAGQNPTGRRGESGCRHGIWRSQPASSDRLVVDAA